MYVKQKKKCLRWFKLLIKNSFFLLLKGPKDLDNPLLLVCIRHIQTHFQTEIEIMNQLIHAVWNENIST